MCEDGEDGFSLFYLLTMQGFEAVEKELRDLVTQNFPEVFVVEVNLAVGPSSVLSFWIDTDEGITIDLCARVSRKLNAWLEENDPFEFPFNLEVSSPGVGRPIKVRRQYYKNVGRKLKVKTIEGKTLTGTLAAVDEEGITMAFDPKKKPKKSENSENTDIKLAFDAIQEAKVEISFD
jgi:ribosome maturation factor RimP